MSDRLQHAMHYSRLGIPVLPLHYIDEKGSCSCNKAKEGGKCKPGKHPYGQLAPHGLANASTEPDVLRKWFDGTLYNLGIRTGTISGFFVLDRDDKDGGHETLAGLERAHGPLPRTLTQRTGNGAHYLFKIPTGIEIRNIQKKSELPGLDVRGDGGYICAAPSLHLSGRQYEWDGCDLMDFDRIADAPAWLIELVSNKNVTTKSDTGFGQKQTSDLSNSVFTIPDRITDGQGRESFLLSYAGHLRGKGNDQQTIERILSDYNQLHIVPPLNGDEVLDKARRYKTASPQNLKNIEAPSWDTPQELKTTLPPVPKFDYQLLPPVFRAWVRDIAERMQCPPDFLAVGAMVAAGSVVGNKIGIQPKRLDAGWVEVPNLWGAVIGRPGVMKTPALAQVMAPLKELEQQAQIAHSSMIAQYQLDKLLHETHMRKFKEQVLKRATAPQPSQIPVAPEEPQPKRFILNDATYQKIGDVLKANPTGLMVFQDELSGLLMRLDSDGQESARAFYLQAWEGKQPYTFDRIERGTVGIPRLCFSMLGGIQPSRIKEYLRSAVNGGKGDDGLAQRLQLMVYPDITKDWVHIDRIPDFQASEAAHAVYRQLANIAPANIGAKDSSMGGIPVMQFDDQAQDAFNRWWGKLETTLRADNRHPALESHISKYRKLIPCLALLDHLIQSKTGPIEKASVMRAISWHVYLVAHAKRAYAVVTAASMESAHALYDRIARGSVKDGFSARDVYRNNWSMLTNLKEVSDAVDVLVDYGWLQPYSDKVPGTEGRPTTRYMINPYLKKAA